MVQEFGGIVAKPSEKGQFTKRFRVDIPSTGETKPRGSRRFRSSGRRRKQTGSIQDAIAQQEARDEEQRQATIQSELSAKAEASRQEGIKSRTIGGQISSGQQGEFQSAQQSFQATGRVQEIGGPPSFTSEAVSGFQGRSPSTVSAVKGDKGVRTFFREIVTEGETQALRGDITPGQRIKTGGAKFALRGAEFFPQLVGLGKALVTDPVGTAKALPGGIVESGKQIVSELSGPSPETAVGSILFDVALFKGTGSIPKGVTKGVDIFRTRGLKELPVGDIVAPEFFAGQTFPQVKKGTTAKELLGEFTTVLPGETKPAGFTASPSPFKKLTKAQRGTSEFPGVFQSPRVSPRFLRVGGEVGDKLFSLDILDTLRPSVVRTTPEEFILSPAIDPKLTRIQPGTRAATREFFETAPKGKSIVPFIKTEKEAIIPFGTGLQFTDKRFFFKFEGRRVPIFEFKTTGKAVGKIDDIGSFSTIEGVSSSLGRGVSRRGKVTPLSSFPISNLVPSDISIRGKKTKEDPFSTLPAPIDRRSLVSSRNRNGISSFRGRGGISSFGEIGGTSSGGGGGFDTFRGVSGISRPAIPILGFETPFEKPPRKRKPDDKKRKKQKEKLGRKFKSKIRPSFTATVLELEGALPKGTSLGGIAPFDIRFAAPGTFRKQSKKKKK